MVDLVIKHGTVVTLNERREVIEDGAVAIDGRHITAVGETAKIDQRFDSDRAIDAAGHAVLPGFISSHAHTSDILLRGGANTDRNVDDWMYNIKAPGVAAMGAEDHAIASALYCQEAIQSGVTTFVENAGGTGDGYPPDVIEAKLDVYDQVGLRNIYAHAFTDREPDQAVRIYRDRLTAKEAAVNHVFPEPIDPEEALQVVESLIEGYHGSAAGRQSVWPAPYFASGVTPDGFGRAYELAEKHDIMTTTHAAEHPNIRVDGLGEVEYLSDIGYLGPRALLSHCVYVDERDIRLISQSGTKIAHNPVTNLALGDGVSPVPTMINSGVTVGLGTDNTSASDTINVINDLRFAALIHKGFNHDAGAMTAEKALEMATIDAARAVGRESELGSLTRGKLADVVLLDLDQPHMIPHTNVTSAIVYQAQGFEVDTVICNGEVIMENRTVTGLETSFPDLGDQARRRSREILERAGLDGLADRSWTSVSGI